LRHLVDAAAHLRGDGQPGVCVVLEERPDDLLAAAVAVDVRGVVEGHTGLEGRLEHGAGVVLADVAPVRPELPGPQAHSRYEPTRPSEYLLFHRSSCCQRARRPVRTRRRAPGVAGSCGHDKSRPFSLPSHATCRRRKLPYGYGVSVTTEIPPV